MKSGPTSYIKMSYLLSSRALEELEIRSSTQLPKELQIVKNPTFRFYRISLQNVFVIEILKLLDNPPKTKYPQQNEGSLEKFLIGIQDLTDERKNEFIKVINEFRNGAEYSFQIKWRDKKLAHFDGDLGISPNSIPLFNDLELKEFRLFLDKIRDLIIQIFDLAGEDFPNLFPRSNTKGFLQNYAK
jgi:hypothetical protein